MSKNAVNHPLLDCLPGYYGYKCAKNCSGHCLNNFVCNYIDGTCNEGCQAGYIGKMCDTCKRFYFISAFFLIQYSSFYLFFLK